MLSTRNFMTSRSKFYRGISLMQYLQKDSQLNNGLQYKDDQTILLDQNKMPVLVDDSVNFVVSYSKSTQSKIINKKNINPKELLKSRRDLDLPTLKMSKAQYLQSKSLNTDRNSTDTSQSNQNETKNVIALPEIFKKSMVRQRNITMASRSSSRQTSCRKKIPITLFEVDQYKQKELKMGKSIAIDDLSSLQQQKKAKHQINIRRYIHRNDPKNKYFNNSKIHQE